MKYKLTTLVASLVLFVVIVTTVPAIAATGYYINSNGQKVSSPVKSEVIPKGASAKCKDGTYSFSKHRSGTCSGHKGVSKWL